MTKDQLGDRLFGAPLKTNQSLRSELVSALAVDLYLRIKFWTRPHLGISLRDNLDWSLREHLK